MVWYLRYGGNSRDVDHPRDGDDQMDGNSSRYGPGMTQPERTLLRRDIISNRHNQKQTN